jgi:ATP-binding cassette subfamily C (CFTR/MRP) protein 1
MIHHIPFTMTFNANSKLQVLGTLLFFLLLTYIAPLLAQHEIIFVVSLLVSSIAALGLSLLFVLEQQRSPKPSDLAILYLFASIICDVVLLTMPSRDLAEFKVLNPVLARSVIHSALLLLECSNGRSSVGIASNPLKPEELHNVFSRLLFIWINPILLRGYRNILVDQDLPALSGDMTPDLTRNAIIETWAQRG